MRLEFNVERSGLIFCARRLPRSESSGELVVSVHVILPPTTLCHGHSAAESEGIL